MMMIIIVPFGRCRWKLTADDKSGKAMTGDTLLSFVNNTVSTLKNNVTPDTP